MRASPGLFPLTLTALGAEVIPLIGSAGSHREPTRLPRVTGLKA